MWQKTLSAMAIAAAVLVATPVLAKNKVVTQMTVAENWPERGFTWRSLGDGVLFRIAPINNNGQLMICGAVQYLDTGNRVQSRSVIRGAKLIVNGNTVLKNLTFMTKVSKRAPLVGAQANCVLTRTPYPKKFTEFRVQYDQRPRRF